MMSAEGVGIGMYLEFVPTFSEKSRMGTEIEEGASRLDRTYCTYCTRNDSIYRA